MSVGKPEFSISSLKTETTLSELVHRVGHDIGNPLTSVISLSSMIERAQSDPAYALTPEDLSRYSASIFADAWKVQGIVEKIVLILSNRGREPEAINMRTVAQDAIRKTLRKPHFKSADVMLSAEGEGLSARIDPAQGEWLICELLTNALNAELAENVECSLSAKLSCLADEIEFLLENRFTHELPSNLSSLFTPFTKSPSTAKGTGLGLTAALAIVERAGGSLTIDSEDGIFRARVRLRR